MDNILKHELFSKFVLFAALAMITLSALVRPVPVVERKPAEAQVIVERSILVNNGGVMIIREVMRV